MKILVLGARGMAGHTVTMYLHEQGHDVTGLTSSSFAMCKNIVCDVTDHIKLKDILCHGHYDYVINCIGLLNQTAENNPCSAIYLNSYLPHYIVELLKKTSTKLIQMSTDCVFAGNTGPYYETSAPDGRTFYDRTKALGEIIDSTNLTFRNSIVGPDINPNGIGLFNWFMKQTGEIQGFTGAMWTGVTTITLAKAMECAMTDKLTGLYNLVNNESISKYDLLKLFNKYFKNNHLTINPNDGLQLDKSLKNTRLNDFSFKVPSYEQQIKEMKTWVDTHKELYPSYF